MRRPCWHFLQAGHSLTSSMQHPPSPDPTPLSALHPGPRIVGPEHLREIVHPLEVRRLVGRLAREQAHIDQREHDPSQVLGAGDAPVPEDSQREQSELLPREVPARPGELPAAQVPARRELALGVLQRRQHEQVAALVIAGVLPPDALERLFERREVAHGRASVCPGVRARTATGRNGCGSSSASSSTSSIVSTGLISSSCFTSSGMSTTSLWLRAGTSTVLTPARAAAVSFSLSPPIGRMRPRSVSSPVIATSWRAGRRHRSDASAVAIAIPADGPSFGRDRDRDPARARSRLHAAWADSFIT